MASTAHRLQDQVQLVSAFNCLVGMVISIPKTKVMAIPPIQGPVSGFAMTSSWRLCHPSGASVSCGAWLTDNICGLEAEDVCSLSPPQTPIKASVVPFVSGPYARAVYVCGAVHCMLWVKSGAQPDLPHSKGKTSSRGICRFCMRLQGLGQAPPQQFCWQNLA